MDDYRGLWATDGMRWAEQRRDLDSLIAEGLTRPEIANVLKTLGIPAIEVIRAIRDKPGVVGRYRRRRIRSAPPTRDDMRLGWIPRRWLRRLPPVVGTLLGLAVFVGYVGLLAESLPLMPPGLWPFALVGMVASAAVAAGLAQKDALLVRWAVQWARDADNWEPAVFKEIVLPELRQYLAEHQKPVYSTELPADRLPADIDDREAPTVVTSAGHQLRRIITRRTPEAVAIAGPRGVGKTTTIHAIADGVFNEPYAGPPLPVIAAAPSRYESRGFLLHLHMVLCQQVIALTSAVLLLPAQEKKVRPTGRRWLRATTPVLLLAVLCVAAAVLWTGPLTALWEQVFNPFALLSAAPSTGVRALVALTLVDVAFVVAVSLSVVWLWRLVRAVSWFSARGVWRRVRGNRYPTLAGLRAEAFQQLRQIRFLHTYTSGWSGKIGLPAGAEAGWSTSVQRAEQNLTNPEIVESFRRFAERSAATLTGAGLVGRIVIAVDELDKIHDPTQAQEMVNDIKGVFGIPNCLFLVSVSEDAMSAFERRGIPVRDAFDSAFTQMVRMDHFTLAESRRWLSRRSLKVPEQFTYLLHCLSGGLPRELRRATIELVDIVTEDGRGDLAHVTGVLLDRELDRKAHAFVAAARRFDDSDELADYVASLVTMPDARTPAEQLALAEQLKPGEPGTELRGVRWQSACFLLFCATVREVFDNTLDESGLGKGVESLALARAQLAVDPRVAWRLVESVRAALSLGPRDA